MSTNQKAIVKKKREVWTYALMWATSSFLLKKGQEDLRGSYHQFKASLVFTAFTLEAYLNHIGEKIFSCWQKYERKPPKKKLKKIAKHLGVKVDYRKTPWKVMNDLFEFRNTIAHGKSGKIEIEKEVPLDEFSDEQFGELHLTDWEKYCTPKNAERAREDVNEIIEVLHSKTGCKDSPFSSGLQFGSVTVLSE